MKRFFSVAAMLGVLAFAGTSVAQSRTFVFDHLLESDGGVNQGTPFSFDTTLFITNSAGVVSGIGGDASDNTTTADIYVFSEGTGGFFLDSQGNAACAPCSLPMGNGGLGADVFSGQADIDASISPRKRKVNVETLLKAQPNVAQSFGVITGYIVVVANGPNAEYINVTSSTVNVQANASALAVFVFEPNEIAAAAN